MVGVSRRSFVRGAGAVGVAALSPLAIGSARAATSWDEKPDDVTIEYDQTVLERYQPALVLSIDAKRQLRSMFGYVARYENEDWDIACYWTQYTHQSSSGDWFGFGELFARDAHHEDHEPSYIRFDSETGEVLDAVYTGYHWFASEISADRANLTEDRATYPTHLNLQVIDPHHHYVHSDDREGAFVDLDDWLSVRESWIDNGFYDAVAVEAVEDPATMFDRSSWWPDGSMDARVGRLWLSLGLRGASERDDHLRED